MHLSTLRCPACGATLNVDMSQSQFKCEFCQNTINLIKPVTSSGIVEGLSEIEQKKYDNYLSILEQAMLAGNYQEGYNYCNKGLEINPNAANLWANKAICSLWLSTVAQLSEDKAMEIITYLNACKQNDPELKIYNETAESIADNLYYCTLYKYNTIQPDLLLSSGVRTFTPETERQVLSCINVIEICNEIHSNIDYLVQTLRLLNTGKVSWFYRGLNSGYAIRQNFDAVKKREKLIEKIKKFYTLDKLEEEAKTDYTKFCSFANEFIGIDRKFYDEYFLPIINKYKPKKPPLTPEQLRRRRRNKIIAYIVILIVISTPIILIILANNFSKNQEKEKLITYSSKDVEVSDSMKNLKTDYDKRYLNSEFQKTNDVSIFARKVLVLIAKDITDKKAKEIANFYKDYYKKWAAQNFNKRLVLQLWFYTEPIPKSFNPNDTYTTEEAKYKKYLYGNIIYNYDNETMKGTIK